LIESRAVPPPEPEPAPVLEKKSNLLPAVGSAVGLIHFEIVMLAGAAGPLVCWT